MHDPVDDGGGVAVIRVLDTDADQVDAMLSAGPGIAELVCDKGSHSNPTLVTLAALGIRSYVSERDRDPRNWRGKHVTRDALYDNRWRIRGARLASGLSAGSGGDNHLGHPARSECSAGVGSPAENQRSWLSDVMLMGHG